MIANVQSPASKFKRAGLVLAMASGVLGATSAWADPEYRSAPLGVYVGGAIGVGINARGCDRFDSGDTGSCSRSSMSSKAFGGYRLTPGLAAEVNYFYFGSVSRSKGPASSNPVGAVYEANVKDSAHAVTLGVNWEVELENILTNHLRAGAAWVHHDTSGYVSTVRTASPLTTTIEDRTGRQLKVVPYFGAGLSFRINEYARIFTGYDFLVDGHSSLHLFSAGISGEY